MWPTVHPFLKPAIERTSGRLDEATVFKGLMTGELVLWAIFRDGPLGAVVTQIFTWPSGLRVARCLLAGGRDHADWLDHFHMIEEWAKEHGCHRLEAWGRPGWERSLSKEKGWRLTGIEMEKEIG